VEAPQLIENLPITAENFKVAWGTIYNRHDNPKPIVTANAKVAVSLAVSKQELSRILKKFAQSA
jgi:hypothetical protein